ncbi:MAG: hypothetical protein ACKOBT_06045 [Actinomycetota bacterium]
MLTICRSTKGGSGTSTVTAGLAAITGLRTITARTSVLVVDLLDDLPAIFGITAPLAGLAEWLTRSTDQDFVDLCQDCGHGVQLMPRGTGPLPDPTSNLWNRLAGVIEHHVASGNDVFMDLGTHRIPDRLECRLAAIPTRSLLVIRPCYLALRRATQCREAFDGVVLVTGGDRVLGKRDVEGVLGIPVVCEVPLDPDVARRVDSGLFNSRLPASLVTALSDLVVPAAP